MKCGARTKTRSGSTCKNNAMANGRCRMHGGKTPVGAALPQFKTGKWSKYLPERLLARYEEAQLDSRLLELRNEVALVDTRLAELLERIDTGQANSIWRSLKEKYAEAIQASGDPERMAHHIDAMGKLIERGGADSEVWEEIGRQIDRRQRLVGSERKRLVDMHQMIPAERATNLFYAFVSIVNRRLVQHEDLRRHIAADIRKLVHEETASRK